MIDTNKQARMGIYIPRWNVPGGGEGRREREKSTEGGREEQNSQEEDASHGRLYARCPAERAADSGGAQICSRAGSKLYPGNSGRITCTESRTGAKICNIAGGEIEL